MRLRVICTSAMGSMTTVSDAVLLLGFGSPSAELLTLAVLVKLPPGLEIESCSGRLTVMSSVTVWPGASAPPDWVQVTAPPAVLLQVKLALPADTVGLRLAKLLRPTIQPGTVSLMRTPVAASLPGLTLLTTSR